MIAVFIASFHGHFGGGLTEHEQYTAFSAQFFCLCISIKIFGCNAKWNTLNLPGGNLLFSISIATTFTISTHIGQSNISFSALTNATSERHWVSNRLRSG